MLIPPEPAPAIPGDADARPGRAGQAVPRWGWWGRGAVVQVARAITAWETACAGKRARCRRLAARGGKRQHTPLHLLCHSHPTFYLLPRRRLPRRHGGGGRGAGRHAERLAHLRRAHGRRAGARVQRVPGGGGWRGRGPLYWRWCEAHERIAGCSAHWWRAGARVQPVPGGGESGAPPAWYCCGAQLGTSGCSTCPVRTRRVKRCKLPLSRPRPGDSTDDGRVALACGGRAARARGARLPQRHHRGGVAGGGPGI